MRWLIAAPAILLLASAPVLLAQEGVGEGAPVLSPVTWDRLLNSDDEPHNWLMYHGALHGQRFSRLDQIDRENVGRLELKWAHQIRQLDRNETTPRDRRTQVAHVHGAGTG